MRPSGRRIRLVSLCLTAAWSLVAGSAFLRAEEPQGAFEVHDVSLWILEPGATLANLRTAYPSALPGMTNSVRSAQSAERARRIAPINLITFYGQAATNLDIDLRTKAGSFLTHWPSGESLPNRLRWAGPPSVDLVEKVDDEAELAFVDDDHWVRRARGAQSLFIRRGARSERFLAYDVELNMAPPIRLEGGPDTFTVINTSPATVYDVLISRSSPEGRRVAWLDKLPKAEAAGAPAPATAAKKGNVARQLFDDAKKTPADAAAQAVAPAEAIEAKKAAGKLFGGLPAGPAQPAAPKAPPRVPVPTATEANGLAKPAAAPLKGTEVILSDPIVPGGDDAADKTTKALAERLTRAGLTSHEAELFAGKYGSLCFEGEAVVVACRLDAGTIDDKIPLSIFPAPKKIVRVAMVVMRNADPQLGNEIERLIAQLGDPKFKVREAAQKQLTGLGPLAFAALQKALSNKDLEVVIRAERILLNQNQTPNAAAQPAGAAIPNILRRVLPAPAAAN